MRGQSGPTLCSLARGTAEERSIRKPGEYLIRERVYLCAVSQSQHITDGIIQQFYLFNISMTVESHYFERMRDLKKKIIIQRRRTIPAVIHGLYNTRLNAGH